MNASSTPRLFSLLLAVSILGTPVLTISQAHAQSEPFFDWKTKKILKGSMVGAGVGAGTALLLHKNVGRTALLGAGVGAGTQAVRYSKILRDHPIVKTAAYGSLVGAGASQLLPEGSLAKGAILGGGVGTAVGAYQNWRTNR